MNTSHATHVLRFEAKFEAVTPLLVRSGRGGGFTDSVVERTADGSLHVNGYVWASLMRRAVSRLQEGDSLAEAWGGYEPEAKPDSPGASPIWTEPSFVEPGDFVAAINPGNRIHRAWGSASYGALYSEEVAVLGKLLSCGFRVFLGNTEQVVRTADLLIEALRVIGQGIENIGGGWSYGFGRLRPMGACWKMLDLRDPESRRALWEESLATWDKMFDEASLLKPPSSVAKGRAWTRIEFKGEVAPGQLLAIHTATPPLAANKASEFPDAFVYRRPTLCAGALEEIPVITGKAFRQAILSREIERRLRSKGEAICSDTSDPSREPSAKDPTQARACTCPRCIWFGDTAAAGIVSVGDALAKEGFTTEIVHRIQLCEHSFQNVQLFSGEYLTKGEFAFSILVDHVRANGSQEGLIGEIRRIIEEMQQTSDQDKREKCDAPPGWHRLGVTSTCTGQLVARDVKWIEVTADR